MLRYVRTMHLHHCALVLVELGMDNDIAVARQLMDGTPSANQPDQRTLNAKRLVVYQEHFEVGGKQAHVEKIVVNL